MDYLCASSYTLFSTAYMMYAFRALRKRFLLDMSRFLCVSVQTDRVKPQEINKMQQTNDHFSHLAKVWESGPTQTAG